MGLFYFSRTTFEKNDIPLPDSITAWHFTGISMSRTHGENCFCAQIFLFYMYNSCFEIVTPTLAFKKKKIDLSVQQKAETICKHFYTICTFGRRKMKTFGLVSSVSRTAHNAQHKTEELKYSVG